MLKGKKRVVLLDFARQAGCDENTQQTRGLAIAEDCAAVQTGMSHIAQLVGTLRLLQHLAENPSSLLNKFYGLYSIRLAEGPRTYVVVMENIFKEGLPLQERYDLKV